MITKILVPLDGSEHADRALEYAMDLAEKYSAHLVLLSVVFHLLAPVSVMPYTDTSNVVESFHTFKKRYERILTKALEKVQQQKPNLNVSTKLMEGRPAEKIVETAKEGDFDLIIMGSRGLGGIKRFLLGSVSDLVADDSPCPILIVK